jgi:hypothetical protein
MSCFSFYLLFVFFYKIREQEETVSALGWGKERGWHWCEEGCGERGRRMNMCKQSIHMCVNAKLYLLKPF